MRDTNLEHKDRHNVNKGSAENEFCVTYKDTKGLMILTKSGVMQTTICAAGAV